MPEQMIDVGGYRLNTHLTGHGTPPVVLLSCAGAGADHWHTITPPLSELTTCLAYGRAGLGGSDPLPDAATRPPGGIAAATAELHTLLHHADLHRAGQRPPFIFLTSSLGAFLADHYTARWPQDIAGLILLDPTNMTPWPDTVEITDVFGEADGGHRYSWQRLWAELAQPRSPTAVPAVVVSSAADSWQRWPPERTWWSPLTLEQVDRLWQDYQHAWAARLGAAHIVARDADHFVHVDAPELVLDVADAVLTAARHGDAAVHLDANTVATRRGDIVCHQPIHG